MQKKNTAEMRCQFVEKVYILINRLSSITPSPNPFPSVKGCVCLVGSASCRAFWHTRPASVPGLLSGAAAPATLLGASPQTPFYLYKEVYQQSEAIGYADGFSVCNYSVVALSSLSLASIMPLFSSRTVANDPPPIITSDVR